MKNVRGVSGAPFNIMALTTTTDFPQINGIPISGQNTGDVALPYPNAILSLETNVSYTKSMLSTHFFTEPSHECDVVQRMSEQYRLLEAEGEFKEQPKRKYFGQGLFQIKGTSSTGPK